jgi:anti-sigma factor RsiW
MMTHTEINQNLQDYVLDLLSPSARDEIAQHLASCDACRRTVKDQRALGALIQSTLNVVGQPDRARLHSMMPAIPKRRQLSSPLQNWSRGFAPALIVLVLIAGALFINLPDSKSPMSLFVAATATATSTNTPTATIAQQSTSSFNSVSLAGNQKAVADLDDLAQGPAGQHLVVPTPDVRPAPEPAVERGSSN